MSARANHRVLFVTQTASPWGGVEAWLDSLVPKLESSGWEVVVGLVRGRRFHDPAVYLEHHRFSNTIEIPALTGTSEGRVRAILRAILRTSPEIVVPVNVADTLEAVRRLRTREDGPRVLYPLHGLGADYFLDAKLFGPVIDFAVSSSRLAATGLARISELPSERVASIRCGVAPPLRLPDRRSDRAPLELGYVGRLTQPEKRVRELVPLCAGLRRAGIDFRLRIAGSGEEEPFLREHLAPEIESGRVSLLGYLRPVDLYELVYPSLDALLLFSERETGPLVVWEAMRHGVVPVTSEYLGLRREGVLRSGINALVSPLDDRDEMVRNLERLDRDRVLLAALRQDARATADRELDLAASLSKWEGAFRTCLSLPEKRESFSAPARPASGRLDRWFGRVLAETLRSVLRRGMEHRDSGGEWPHSLYCGDPSLAGIESEIAKLDIGRAMTPVADASEGVAI